MPGPRVEVKPMDEGLRQYKAFYFCAHCGDEIGNVKRLHCKNCQTAAGRAEVDRQNAAIRSRLDELRSKGEWIYATA